MEFDFLRKRIGEHIEIGKAISGDAHLLELINGTVESIVSCYKKGGRVLLCGNGGSAADAQHIAAELVGRFYKNRKGLDAEALSVNSSTITAIANDYSYDEIFARQVEAKGRKGDVLFGISTSGNSPNVIRALEKGNVMGLTTIGMTGGSSGARISTVSKICIAVPTTVTPRIQEAHILIGHLICEQVEELLFP